MKGKNMFNLKESKFVKALKAVKPRLKWLMFSQMQDYKINSNYIDMICNDKEKAPNTSSESLEAMVRETLIKEFGPEIQKSASYELLVDAVLHNLKKKQLAELDKD